MLTLLGDSTLWLKPQAVCDLKFSMLHFKCIFGACGTIMENKDCFELLQNTNNNTPLHKTSTTVYLYVAKSI